MFTSATFTVFLFAVTLTRGQIDEDPECRPSGPPGKEPECCTIPMKLFGDEVQEAVVKNCFDEAGMKKPSGPHGGGSPPTAEEMAAHISAHECAEECVFKSGNFIKSDGGLDEDAIKAVIAKLFTGDWAPIATAAVNKCLASAKSGVSASAKCKSGAYQLSKCFQRELFLGCPASIWTESTDCSAIKARITKCPNAKVPIGHHHKH
ncbi:hypothetical protein GE061_019395 [Apolygus lucorum]|uniref:Uncharacterized protein n=1 Tax=Apolygus lucorum TaxID=248454 RepID=A0A6A4JNA3_APOLU|nr:hypothetical protein GE061_019395 [Apolygus lucorum]